MLLLWSIYHQIQRQPNWYASYEQIKAAFLGPENWKIIFVLVLMGCNWGLEARKWQLAVNSIQQISLWRAYRAIFSGNTLGFFTPNRIGEYLGRIWYIPEGKRLQAISLTIACSIAQLCTTLWLGVIGLYMAGHWYQDTAVAFWVRLIFFLALAGAVILTVLYFRLGLLVHWLGKVPKLGKFLRFTRVLENFNATILLRLLSLSLVRYGVFMLQYYLLFDVFSVELGWWQVFWSMSTVFLILAILPSIAVLTDLGIRWQASIQLIQVFSTNTVGILAVSLAIWVINLVIPALIGSVLILGIRLFRSK